MPANIAQPRRTNAAPRRLAPPRPAASPAHPFVPSQAASSNALRLAPFIFFIGRENSNEREIKEESKFETCFVKKNDRGVTRGRTKIQIGFGLRTSRQWAPKTEFFRVVVLYDRSMR